MGNIKMMDMDDKICSFCGKEATAYWHGLGGSTINCCRECATTILPKLMADAILDDDPFNWKHINIIGILKEFWYGVACSLRRAKIKTEPAVLASLRKEKEREKELGR